MDIKDTIIKKLEKKLKIYHFELKDFTGRHLNHEQHNGGFHFESVIISEDFKNLTLINRHKVVYEALGKLLEHEIHAFSMKTLTPEEWEKVK